MHSIGMKSCDDVLRMRRCCRFANVLAAWLCGAEVRAAAAGLAEAIVFSLSARTVDAPLALRHTEAVTRVHQTRTSKEQTEKGVN